MHISALDLVEEPDLLKRMISLWALLGSGVQAMCGAHSSSLLHEQMAA